ncbi:MAG: hypothetical protein J0L88_14335, partial [Xanthomonadales bacterium]|nr:hypothetical protein [Xanthomonadales bacterium]
MQKPLPDRTCLCVYGSAACAADWLASVQAQLPTGTRLLLAGASAAHAVAGASRHPELAADSAEAVLAALAVDIDGDTVVLVRSDAELPPHAIVRLLEAVAVPGVRAAGALDNLDPQRSPLPTGERSDAATAHLDAL